MTRLLRRGPRVSDRRLLAVCPVLHALSKARGWDKRAHRSDRRAQTQTAMWLGAHKSLLRRSTTSWCGLRHKFPFSARRTTRPPNHTAAEPHGRRTTRRAEPHGRRTTREAGTRPMLKKGGPWSRRSPSSADRPGGVARQTRGRPARRAAEKERQSSDHRQLR